MHVTTSINFDAHTHTHTHTHIYIYTYMEPKMYTYGKSLWKINHLNFLSLPAFYYPRIEGNISANFYQ